MLTTHLPIYLASSKSLLWRMSHCVVITCLLFMFTVCVSVYCPAVPWPGAGLRAAASRLLWLCAGWRLFVRLSGPAEPDRSEAAGSGWGSSGPGARDIGPGQGGEERAASEVTRASDQRWDSACVRDQDRTEAGARTSDIQINERETGPGLNYI